VSKRKKIKRSILYIPPEGEDYKKVTFLMPVASYLQMKHDMGVDGIRFTSDLMSELIRLYLEKDDNMLECINKIKQVISYQGKMKREHLSSEYLKGKEFLKNFDILGEEERRDLFDIIEGSLSEDEIYKV